MVLEDGSSFAGVSLGAEGETFGEAVFNTGMAGYQEVLTDPSYARQIVSMTSPHVGNYGMNPRDRESERIRVAGFAVREAARRPSSWRAERTLREELADRGVVGIEGIDTRRLTLRLRDRGAMRAVFAARRLEELGFRLIATGGTAAVLGRAGIPVERVAKVSEGEPNVVDLIEGGRVDLVINTRFGRAPRTDGSQIRIAAASAGVPCITTLPGVMAAVHGIEALREGPAQPRSLQEYHAAAAAAPVQARLTLVEATAAAHAEGAAPR